MIRNHAGDLFRPWICIVVALAVAVGSAQVAAQSGSVLLGKDGMSAQAVRQGVLGSCYFHASIASLAQTAPELLRNAISQNADGSYQVHFFDGPAELVFPEDVAFGRAHGYDRSQGDWVLVLMRAYAQRTVRLGLTRSIEQSNLIPAFAKPVALDWLDRSGMLLVAYDRAIRAVIQQDGTLDKAGLKRKLTEQFKAVGVPETEVGLLQGFLDERGFFDALVSAVQQNGEVFGDYKEVGQGGIPERVMQAFLGDGKTGIVATDRQIAEQFRQLHAGKLAMVASTWENAKDAGLKEGAPEWWVANHAYSVLDYDPATGLVSLRNPWGYRPGHDGIFKLSLAEFQQAYQIYTYAEPDVR